MKLKFILCLFLLLGLTLVSLFWGLADFQSVLGRFVFWNLRLPRVLLAVLIGASLTLAGVVYQTIFKNSLAEPYLLGVSSGAACGAALTLILGISYSARFLTPVSFFALVGGILAVALVYLMAVTFGPVKTEKLILLGVGTSALFTAALAMIIIFSDQLRAIYFWLLGSLVNASWEKFLIIFVAFTFSFLIILFLNRKLDILKLPDDEAYSLGVNVFWTQIILIIFATGLTALAVSFAGIIGFVGLLGPHIARRLFGETHLKLLPGSVLVGAIFLLAADTLARTVFYPAEIPLGIVTAAIGAPYFIYLLLKQDAR